MAFTSTALSSPTESWRKAKGQILENPIGIEDTYDVVFKSLICFTITVLRVGFLSLFLT